MIIKVSDNAKYAGQDMAWTESMFKSKSSGVFYHWSDTQIKEFKAKETCFWKDDGSDIYGEGYLYKITIETDRDCMESEYDDEFRFQLTSDDKLEFVGQYKLINTGRIIIVNGGGQPEYRCEKVG